MNQKVEKYLGNVIAFFIVLLVGSSIAKEINKQLPPEFKISFKKIFFEALLFALIIGALTYLILNAGGIC
jgi:phosphate/sulfate permease